MHTIEPYFNWRDQYTAETDNESPFFGRSYSELAFETTVYNYFIHPQWDSIDSESLFVKLLYVNDNLSFCVIELIGEWNDAIQNDIELLRRNLVDPLLKRGISKYVLIGENVLNFHGDDDDYYAEWFEEVLDQDGYIVCINFREHVREEIEAYNLKSYLFINEPFTDVKWRPYKPEHLFEAINRLFSRYIDAGLEQI